MKTQVLDKPPLRQLLKRKEKFLSKSELIGFNEVPEIRVPDYLSGRFALKTLFASMFDYDVKLSEVNVVIQDKMPQIYFKDTTYYCSISHSKKYVACSVNRLHQNGIDIEELRPRSKELQKYIVGHDESSYFDTDEQFLTTRVWSIKEAAFKSDSSQMLITDYAICGQFSDLFLVRNVQTGRMIRVKNRIIDNYTVSYTIPSTI